MQAWNRAIRLLEGWSRWNILRSLGNSNLVRASVLMPAFGYMLLLNDNVHQYLTIKYDGWLLHYLPSVWRIWFLFYGSFLLAAANCATNFGSLNLARSPSALARCRLIDC